MGRHRRQAAAAAVRAAARHDDDLLDVLHDPCRLIRAKQLARILGIHEQTVWRWQRQGRLPKAIKLGEMTTAWRSTDIQNWLQQKAAATLVAE